MKRLELHYNKKFNDRISAYSWLQIHKNTKSFAHISMTYNRAEYKGHGGTSYDYSNDFAIHLWDEKFNVTHIHIDDFNFTEYGFSNEDIEFFKVALKSQFVNGERKKNPRDVCSKFTLLSEY